MFLNGLQQQRILDKPTTRNICNQTSEHSDNRGVVIQQLVRWIQDRKVHGSIPSQCSTK